MEVYHNGGPIYEDHPHICGIVDERLLHEEAN